MRSRAFLVSLLLFGSGSTALVYQIAWMRELRLVFGFSTAASAAVVAIFMGGLSVGSWILGRRADAAARPLAFYGKLELAIAASAAVTPALLWLVRLAYIGLGGSARLGFLGRTPIHPKQIAPIRKAYAVPEAEVLYYMRIVSEFEAVEKTGTAAITVDGKLVDYAMYQRAKRVLELAKLDNP